MKALFLTHSFPRAIGDPPGSFLLRLAQALRDEQVEVRVIAPAGPGLAAHEELDGIPVDRFRYAPRRFETLAYVGNMADQVRGSWTARLAMLAFIGSEMRTTRGEIRRWKPDVVHAHWWFPNGAVATRLASSVPVVTTMHGTDVRLARSVGALRPEFRRVLRRSAEVTVVSRWLARESEAIVSTRAPIVAPMPVDVTRFHPAGKRARDRLLFVGRLNQQKGIATLLGAMPELDPTISLDVVGDGEDREALRQLASSFGIDGRIRWHGAKPNHELPPLYQAATALVMPSIDEGLGLVAVEAQLCETPVIAFDSGGLPDVVEHGRTGLLVEPFTSAALATAIRDLLARPDAGRDLGRAGRERAIDLFGPAAVARRYRAIYEHAVARRA